MEYMDWREQAYIIFQIFVAFSLGGFIGFERERHSIGAGIRTYAAVCMGAAMFTIVGNHLMDGQGASRMVSNIITGIGFLGAGLIFKGSGFYVTDSKSTSKTKSTAATDSSSSNSGADADARAPPG